MMYSPQTIEEQISEKTFFIGLLVESILSASSHKVDPQLILVDLDSLRSFEDERHRLEELKK